MSLRSRRDSNTLAMNLCVNFNIIAVFSACIANQMQMHTEYIDK